MNLTEREKKVFNDILERNNEMQDFRKTISTKAGELYAVGSSTSLNQYIEIGYYDEEGNMIPLSAVEVKTKELSPEIDEKEIKRVIYNLNDLDEYISEMAKKGE